MNFSTWTKFDVVEVVDRPQSQQVLSTRWVSKQRLQSETCGTRKRTNGQIRCRLLCRYVKAHDFAKSSHNSCTSRKSSAILVQANSSRKVVPEISHLPRPDGSHHVGTDGVAGGLAACSSTTQARRATSTSGTWLTSGRRPSRWPV